jgi:hypothetical protein
LHPQTKFLARNRKKRTPVGFLNWNQSHQIHAFTGGARAHNNTMRVFSGKTYENRVTESNKKFNGAKNRIQRMVLKTKLKTKA